MSSVVSLSYFCMLTYALVGQINARIRIKVLAGHTTNMIDVDSTSQQRRVPPVGLIPFCKMSFNSMLMTVNL